MPLAVKVEARVRIEKERGAGKAEIGFVHPYDLKSVVQASKHGAFGAVPIVGRVDDSLSQTKCADSILG